VFFFFFLKKYDPFVYRAKMWIFFSRFLLVNLMFKTIGRKSKFNSSRVLGHGHSSF
jgi:hypothetical protein